MNKQKVITIFGSSSPRPGNREYDNALELGKLLAGEGFAICNGGYGGTMEAAAKGAREAGGKVIGVTVGAFGITTNRYIDEEIKTEDLYERLRKLVEAADAFVVLKGGSGTLLEFCLCLEMMIKGIIARRPLVIVGDFFKDVVALVEREALQNSVRGNLNEMTSTDDFLVSAKNPKEAVRELKRRLS